MTHHRHYKHLHIPPTWEQYWSKYPNGYSIMESLIDWVSQTNKMIESFNNLSDEYVTLNRNMRALEKELRASWKGYKEHTEKTYEDFRDEILTIVNQWIATIEPTIQDEVVKSLNQWLDDGTLADIINNDVFDMKANQSDLDDTNAQLAQIENKSVVSITDFGEIDDGEDITTLFNEAVRHTQLNNQTLYIPENLNFTLSDEIEVLPRPNVLSITGGTNSTITFNGQGSILYRLKYNGVDGQNNYLLNLTNVTYKNVGNGRHVVYMEDGATIGSSNCEINNNTFMDFGDEVLRLWFAWRIRIKENKFIRCGNSIYAYGANGANIFDNMFLYGTGYGTRIEGQSYAMNIHSNLFEQVQHEGIILAGATGGSIVQANYFEAVGIGLLGDDYRTTIRVGDSQHSGVVDYESQGETRKATISATTFEANRASDYSKMVIFNAGRLTLINNVMDLVIPTHKTGMELTGLITVIGSPHLSRNNSIASEYRHLIYNVSDEFTQQRVPISLSYNNLSIEPNTTTAIDTIPLQNATRFDIYSHYAKLSTAQGSSRVQLILFDKTNGVELYRFTDDWRVGTPFKPLYSTRIDGNIQLEIRVEHDYSSTIENIGVGITFGLYNPLTNTYE